MRGASICPFMCDPHFGHVYFLLGSEHLVSSWTEGSLLVSDFGGSSNSWDSCCEQTAAREFFEETCGMVAFDFLHQQGPFPLKRSKTIEDITNKLKNGHFWIKLQNASFTTFVVNIPWDPQCVVRFQHCRTLLSALNHQCRKQPLRLLEVESLYPPDLSLRKKRHAWIIHHPAVMFIANTATAAATAATAAAANSKVKVTGIKQHYLEKGSISLYSVIQLRQMLKSTTNAVKHAFVEVLKRVVF